MSDINVKRTCKGRRPKFNDDPAIDNVHAMVMALATELSVLHDRMDTMERVAAGKGVMLSDELDSFVPDQETLVAREQWRQQLLRRMFYLLREQVDDVSKSETDTSYRSFLEEIA